MSDRQHVEVEDDLSYGRKQGLENGVRLLGGRLLTDQAKALTHPMDVDVHGEGWLIEGEEKRAGGGLGPDPRQRFQLRLGFR